VECCRSHFDILEELRAFEAAFVSELNAGAAERAEAKRRKADARAEEEAAATVRRRQEQEQWLEGERSALPGELTLILVPFLQGPCRRGELFIGGGGFWYSQCQRTPPSWRSGLPAGPASANRG
jgi:hypothetical protein